MTLAVIIAASLLTLVCMTMLYITKEVHWGILTIFNYMTALYNLHVLPY